MVVCCFKLSCLAVSGRRLIFCHSPFKPNIFLIISTTTVNTLSVITFSGFNCVLKFQIRLIDEPRIKYEVLNCTSA